MSKRPAHAKNRGRRFASLYHDRKTDRHWRRQIDLGIIPALDPFGVSRVATWDASRFPRRISSSGSADV